MLRGAAGIAVGIAVVDSYDSHSVTARAVQVPLAPGLAPLRAQCRAPTWLAPQLALSNATKTPVRLRPPALPAVPQGTLNGLAGGLLLYLAAAMILSDFGGLSPSAGAPGVQSCAAGGYTPAHRPWVLWEWLLLYALLVGSAAGFAVLAQWA